ncbi:MAG TPA: hypothetical protein VMX17_07520 [Candidatus Glassbacteria bacterium]|nr:hypothetical protein [Candidatus Glassbacteria bacterium]
MVVTTQTDTDMDSEVISLNEVKVPYIRKDVILMSPGVWKGFYYAPEEIKAAYTNTDWQNRYVADIFYDHKDTSAKEWIGKFKNIKLDEIDSTITGDMYLYNPQSIINLKYGKAKVGISPKVYGMADEGRMKDFIFENQSVVIEPAVKTAFLNSEITTNEVQELTEWSTAYLNDLPDSAFMWIEPNQKQDEEGKTVPRTARHLPVKDKDSNWDLPHVKNALTEIKQVKSLPVEKQSELVKKLEAVIDHTNKNVAMSEDKEIIVEQINSQKNEDSKMENKEIKSLQDELSELKKSVASILEKLSETEEPKEEEKVEEVVKEEEEVKDEEKEEEVKEVAEEPKQEKENAEEEEKPEEEPKDEEVENNEKVSDANEEKVLSELKKFAGDFTSTIEKMNKKIQNLSEQIEENDTFDLTSSASVELAENTDEKMMNYLNRRLN